ncbi:flagellar biosynthetic protein FliO [Pseudomonas aeruginosa]|nr:flagellar biosynthetic protein FliO [Pseudomonas aeruginosa]
MRRYLFAGFLPALASLSAPLCAAEGTTGAAAPTVGAASGAAAQLAQLVLGLGLVIGLIFLLAWLVRRVQQAGPRGNRLIRTLASQPLGPRDRLVLVQVGEEQILLGLTPGRITPLHMLKEPVHLPDGEPATPEFAQRLLELLNKDPKGKP